MKQLFDPMFDEYFESQQPHEPVQQVADPNVIVVDAPHATNGPSTSISLDLDALECSNSQHESNVQSPSEYQ